MCVCVWGGGGWGGEGGVGGSKDLNGLRTDSLP